MDKRDLELRNHVYRRFAELGRAPGLAETAAELGLPAEEMEAGLRRLHDAHWLVLEEDGAAIRMANPFSAVPTPHLVEADGRTWYANCAWDAFGIPAALGVDGHVASVCPDCGETIEMDMVDQRPEPDHGVFHVLVPARSWWADIAFT
jgi:alkylmercury lyase-like protein